MVELIGGLIGLLLVFVGTACFAMLNGFVLKVMWGWFLTPLGLPAIGLAMAIGLSTIVGLLSHTPIDTKKKETNPGDLWNSLAILFLKPLICLAVGWVVHKCM